MKQLASNRAWDDLITNPLGGRYEKPRDTGLTMVIDTGLGLLETQDVLELTSLYIDFVKLGFGTSMLYPESILRRKITLLKECQIHVYPGGTFLEVAILQKRWREFMNRSYELGFTAIEVSDGTITYERSLRKQLIRYARSLGFLVLSEVGKKENGVHLPIEQQYDMINQDLEAGAFKVIIEGRESGKGVGIYEEDGALRTREIEKLYMKLGHIDSIIWEAPLKSQQQEFISMFGNNVNMGNIHPRDIIALESLRCGLRGDTLRHVVNAQIFLTN